MDNQVPGPSKASDVHRSEPSPQARAPKRARMQTETQTDLLDECKATWAKLDEQQKADFISYISVQDNKVPQLSQPKHLCPECSLPNGEHDIKHFLEQTVFCSSIHETESQECSYSTRCRYALVKHLFTDHHVASLKTRYKAGTDETFANRKVLCRDCGQYGMDPFGHLADNEGHSVCHVDTHTIKNPISGESYKNLILYKPPPPLPPPKPRLTTLVEEVVEIGSNESEINSELDSGSLTAPPVQVEANPAHSAAIIDQMPSLQPNGFNADWSNVTLPTLFDVLDVDFSNVCPSTAAQSEREKFLEQQLDAIFDNSASYKPIHCMDVNEDGSQSFRFQFFNADSFMNTTSSHSSSSPSSSAPSSSSCGGGSPNYGSTALSPLSMASPSCPEANEEQQLPTTSSAKGSNGTHNGPPSLVNVGKCMAKAKANAKQLLSYKYSEVVWTDPNRTPRPPIPKRVYCKSRQKYFYK